MFDPNLISATDKAVLYAVDVDVNGQTSGAGLTYTVVDEWQCKHSLYSELMKFRNQAARDRIDKWDYFNPLAK